MKSIVLLWSAGLTNCFAHAEPNVGAPDSEIYRKKTKLSEPGIQTVVTEGAKISAAPEAGSAFVLGFGVGGSFVSPQKTDVEGPKSGLLYVGKAMFSFYPESFVFDLGIGWQYGSLSGKEVVPDNTNAAKDKLIPVEVVTQSAFSDAAIRYRIIDDLQVGIIGQIAFGTDLSYTSREKSMGVLFLGGLSVMYGVPRNTADFRYGVQALIGLNSPNRQIVNALFTLEMGVPFAGNDRIVSQRVKETTQTKMKTQTDVSLKKVIEVQKVTKFLIERDVLSLDGNKSDFESRANLVVTEISKILMSEKALWNKMTVNVFKKLNVSTQDTVRMEYLKSSFAKKGIVFEKQSTVQKGIEDVVEMNFTGVTNPEKLNGLLVKCLERHRTPETCKENKCK